MTATATTARIAIKLNENKTHVMIVLSDGVRSELLMVEDGDEIVTKIDRALFEAGCYRTESLRVESGTMVCYGSWNTAA